VIIRKGELKDIDDLIVLIKGFFEESVNDYGFRINDETIRKTAILYITKLVVIVAEDAGSIAGFVAGVISPSIFDESQMIGQESVWYVGMNYRHGTIGLKLIKEFENECKSRGAELVVVGLMGNLNTDILDKYYKKRNYKLLQRDYIK